MKQIVSSAILLMLFFPSCRGENTRIIYYEGLSLNGIEITIDSLGAIVNGVLAVRDTIDLKGYTCSIPEGIQVDLTNGQIRNGELVGHNNKLKCNDGAFHRVRIKGEWIVPIIKSSFFSDLAYDNSICDIIALSNEKIKNRIIIEKGYYQVTINSPWNSAVNLNRNTELILNGTIRLTPNDHPGCYIVNVKGENIRISGNGRIVGDKESHTGTRGEWGMGIYIDNSQNVRVSGITVESCWGDCIYVGDAECIKIYDCTLKNSRRQGISITAASNVIIKHCFISGIKGTAPEYAIDVEPNENDKCQNIKIERVIVRDCEGGVLLWGAAKGATVNTIKVKLCKFDNVKKTPFCIGSVDNVNVEHCKITGIGKKEPFALSQVKNFKKKNIVIE